MKQQKNKMVVKVVFAMMFAMLLLPMLNYKNIWLKELYLHGSESQAERPTWSIKSYFDGQYQDSFTNFVSAKLPLRSYAIKAHNQILFSAFKYTTAAQVIIGKENYLYETPYLNAFNGNSYIGDAEIIKRSLKLQKIQNALAKRNKKLLVLFAPGKASYFPEKIPNDFYKERVKNNHRELIKAYQKHQISYIDFLAYFNELKANSKFPLYGKYGIHWSQFGMSLAMDSALKKIAQEFNRKFASKEKIKTEQLNNYRFTDNDVELALNLYFDLPKEQMAYRSFEWKENASSFKPNVLVVADSYWWLVHNNYISKKIFNDYHFLYYNKSIYNFDQQLNIEITPQLISEYVNSSDLIILMATEANDNWFPYGFDDVLLNELAKPIIKSVNKLKEEAIQLKMNDIKKDATWYASIVTKAEQNKTTTIQQLRADAIWVLQGH
jgi:hypothetical protein